MGFARTFMCRWVCFARYCLCVGGYILRDVLYVYCKWVCLAGYIVLCVGGFVIQDTMFCV